MSFPPITTAVATASAVNAAANVAKDLLQSFDLAALLEANPKQDSLAETSVSPIDATTTSDETTWQQNLRDSLSYIESIFEQFSNQLGNNDFRVRQGSDGNFIVDASAETRSGIESTLNRDGQFRKAFQMLRDALTSHSPSQVEDSLSLDRASQLELENPSKFLAHAQGFEVSLQEDFQLQKTNGRLIASLL